jgi:Cu/Ag efflux pump CusA
VAYCDTKLKGDERKDPKEGGLDVTKVVQKVDKSLEIKAERQVKHRQHIKMQMKEKKHRKVGSAIDGAAARGVLDWA